MLLTFDTVGNVVRFIEVLFLFFVVLGITYFATRYVAGIQKDKAAGSNIKVIEISQLAPNKYLEIVKVGKKYYCLAVSKENVSLIGELSEDDIDLDSINSSLPPSFTDVLKKVTAKLPDKKNSTFAENEGTDLDKKDE